MANRSSFETLKAIGSSITDAGGIQFDIDEMNVDLDSVKPASVINAGANIAVGTVAERVAIAEVTGVKHGIMLTAKTTNTDTVYVGPSGITAGTDASSGTPIEAGESLTVGFNDPYELYCITPSGSQTLFYMAV